MKPIYVGGVAVFQGFLSPQEQAEIVGDLRSIVRAAPLFHPTTRRGTKMSVAMTSAGDVGWISDRKGYRYEARHPDGTVWPQIPDTVLAVWRALSGVRVDPDSCLVNFYQATAKMGLHQDKDEADFAMPVISISLGDDALFRVGGTTRGGKSKSIWLKSGDVAVIGGEARLAYHGIDRIRSGSSTLLSQGGRLNVTLRVAQ